jgi:flagellar hook assembly protein FlgD
VPERSRVTVEVYNVIGQRVKTLVREEMAAGYHVVEWNGTGNSGQQLGSGVYFVRLSAGNDNRSFSSVRKLMMVK